MDIAGGGSEAGVTHDLLDDRWRYLIAQGQGCGCGVPAGVRRQGAAIMALEAVCEFFSEFILGHGQHFVMRRGIAQGAQHWQDESRHGNSSCFAYIGL